MGRGVVNGGGVTVSEDIELGGRGEIGEGFVLVLMAFDVEYVDLDGELFDESVDSLDDVVVRCQKVEV